MYHQELRTAEYSDLKLKFPVLLHLLCLLYSNCVSYSKPVRIITLLQVPLKLSTTIKFSMFFALGDQQPDHREDSQVFGLLHSLYN